MQTTVNDIASLFMGNPGALQNRIQKEQQAKPGIPPDLKELLALQQINEQIQASQQQQALQNPQNQPTVAQSLQQRAKQALMARQVQAQQMQMARAGQMGLPQGIPQPQRQPQMGLDQIQSNLGEYYGGGIVAFNGKDGSEVKEKYETPYDRMNRLNREAEAARGKQSELVNQIPGQSDYVAPEGEKIDSSELERNIRNTILASGASVSRLATAPRQALALLSEAFQRKVPQDRKESAKSEPLPDYTNDLAPGMRAGQPIIEAPPKPPAPRPRPTGIAASPRVNPPAQQLELAGPPVSAMNPPVSQVQSELAKIAGMNPAEIEKQRREQYDTEVGKPQFAEERELIKELQARRANIGKGTNPLLDLLEGIATTAPGRGGVLSQGAEGVRNARAMQQQREQQNMDMLKEILGQQKTISTGERAYKENLFSLGKKVYDETFSQRFEALKAQGVDEREARRLASEEARAAQRLILEREQMASQEKQTNARIAAQRELSPEMQFALNNPEQYAKIQAMKNPSAENRGQLTRKDAEKIVTDRLEGGMAGITMMRETQELLKKQGNPNPTASDVVDYLVQKMMVGSPYAPKEGAVNPGNRAPLSSFQR